MLGLFPTEVLEGLLVLKSFMAGKIDEFEVITHTNLPSYRVASAGEDDAVLTMRKAHLPVGKAQITSQVIKDVFENGLRVTCSRENLEKLPNVQGSEVAIRRELTEDFVNQKLVSALFNIVDVFSGQKKTVRISTEYQEIALTPDQDKQQRNMLLIEDTTQTGDEVYFTKEARQYAGELDMEIFFKAARMLATNPGAKVTVVCLTTTKKMMPLEAEV